MMRTESRVMRSRVGRNALRRFVLANCTVGFQPSIIRFAFAFFFLFLSTNRFLHLSDQDRSRYVGWPFLRLRPITCKRKYGRSAAASSSAFNNVSSIADRSGWRLLVTCIVSPHVLVAEPQFLHAGCPACRILRLHAHFRPDGFEF